MFISLKFSVKDKDTNPLILYGEKHVLIYILTLPNLIFLLICNFYSKLQMILFVLYISHRKICLEIKYPKGNFLQEHSGSFILE